MKISRKAWVVIPALCTLIVMCYMLHINASSSLRDHNRLDEELMSRYVRDHQTRNVVRRNQQDYDNRAVRRNQQEDHEAMMEEQRARAEKEMEIIRTTKSGGSSSNNGSWIGGIVFPESMEQYFRYLVRLEKEDEAAANDNKKEKRIVEDLMEWRATNLANLETIRKKQKIEESNKRRPATSKRDVSKSTTTNGSYYWVNGATVRTKDGDNQGLFGNNNKEEQKTPERRRPLSGNPSDANGSTLRGVNGATLRIRDGDNQQNQESLGNNNKEEAKIPERRRPLSGNPTNNKKEKQKVRLSYN